MSIQFIPQINYTREYEKFKLFDANRPLSAIHVEHISQHKDFVENFPTCPIIVNEQFYIIDGQHRFEAAKSLDCGIFYIIQPNGRV
jgi:hypothetical protein